METKTLKISESNYRFICKYAGDLQKKVGAPVSIDKALTFILRKSRLSDLAGSWKISNKEAEDMMKTIRKGWSNWKIKSV